MNHLLVLAMLLFPALSWAHNCQEFLTSDWPADEGYACEVTKSDLSKLQMHKIEVCIGSVPYRDGQRYAKAELKYIPLSQYENIYNKSEGLHTKFLNSTYIHAWAGEEMQESAKYLQMNALEKGSSLLHTLDVLNQLQLDKQSLQARLVIQSREPALLFQNDWNKSWDLRLKCQRVF
ncbi:hypothetical protein [Bdellovibrio bacteriovorus]|uniref:Uncharacterized protein n=1 Tax=Bdellovibrio bacteriovorus str. Tiberius TaxID=1069642 RepID=K7Z1X3_BDEBC|nr:hypothetical protein [Bdellovibrio bacteriovorus]AFY03090.1 hypothetical protein Bdt_3415 [Bdellovibrio bacteriovorus str. Tiberius]